MLKYKLYNPLNVTTLILHTPLSPQRYKSKLVHVSLSMYAIVPSVAILLWNNNVCNDLQCWARFAWWQLTRTHATLTSGSTTTSPTPLCAPCTTKAATTRVWCVALNTFSSLCLISFLKKIVKVLCFLEFLHSFSWHVFLWPFSEHLWTYLIHI